MKRIISLMLAMVMIVAMVVPAATYSVELSKGEVLFNELHNDFGSMLEDLDTEVLINILGTEAIAENFYSIFMDELAKNEDLEDLLAEEDGEIKNLIKALLSEDNITILLSEIKSGEADESLPILQKFIEAVEKTFDMEWKDLIDLAGADIAKDILAKLEAIITPAPTFNDIDNHWSKTYVLEMAKEGVLEGYPGGSFIPNGLVTRAEFSKMMVSVLELTVVDYTTGFSDVFSNEWFADYVATMASKNYVAGYPDGTFKPNDNISRTEMAKILSNVIEVVFTEEESVALISGFVDANEIPEWALDAVAEVTKAELIQGDNNNNFNPTDNATRGEAAAVIYRLFNK